MGADALAFGRLLRTLRVDAGKSQGDVAKYLGVSTTYVSDVERGTRAPYTRARLVVLASYLDVPLARLLHSAALYHGETGLPLSDARRNAIAAALAARWESLSPESLERIAREAESS